MTDAELLALMKEIQPHTQKIPPGIRELVDAIAMRLTSKYMSEIRQLEAAIKKQTGALKTFQITNLAVALAQVPEELKAKVKIVEKEVAEIKAVNSILTDEVEKLEKEVQAATNKHIKKYNESLVKYLKDEMRWEWHGPCDNVNWLLGDYHTEFLWQIQEFAEGYSEGVDHATDQR